jgi:benzoyl-CoA-dihydrodiol lyase
MVRDMAKNAVDQPPVSFQTGPEDYVHLSVQVEGAVARIVIEIQEERGLRPGYVLKLNSYDLGVQGELL